MMHSPVVNCKGGSFAKSRKNSHFSSFKRLTKSTIFC